MFLFQKAISLLVILCVFLGLRVKAQDNNFTASSSTVDPVNKRLKRATPAGFDPHNLPPASKVTTWAQNEEWRESYTRGVGLWETLQNAMRDLPSEDCPILQPPDWTVENHTAVELFTDWARPECKSDDVLGLLDAKYNSPPSPPLTEKICSNSFDRFRQETRKGLPVGKDPFLFENWYSSASGTIIAACNYARYESTGYQTSPTWFRSPYNWTQVAFATWSYVCSVRRQLLSVLRFIVQNAVNNEATQQTALSVCNDRQEDGVFDHYGKDEDGDDWEVLRYDLEFTYEDAHFYALLGTPNGVGAPRLLSTFANAFATRGDLSNPDQITKVKTVGKIKVNADVFNHNDIYNLAVTFILDDIDAPVGFKASNSPAVPATIRGLPYVKQVDKPVST